MVSIFLFLTYTTYVEQQRKMVRRVMQQDRAFIIALDIIGII